jgi:hypothetical protein
VPRHGLAPASGQDAPLPLPAIDDCATADGCRADKAELAGERLQQRTEYGPGLTAGECAQSRGGPELPRHSGDPDTLAPGVQMDVVPMLRERLDGHCQERARAEDGNPGTWVSGIHRPPPYGCEQVLRDPSARSRSASRHRRTTEP